MTDKDKQFRKERTHIFIWAGIIFVVMVIFQDFVTSIKWWALLFIPIFIFGSFITSGASSLDEGLI